MWVAAFFGMATKYSEGLLAIKYRTKDDNGEISGGPMYYIINGMGKRWKPLAAFFAVAGVLVAYFGIGTFSQVNSITSSLENSFGLAPQIVSVVIAVLVAIIIFGGIQSISKVAEKVVPFMLLFILLPHSLLFLVTLIRLYLHSVKFFLELLLVQQLLVGLRVQLLKRQFKKGLLVVSSLMNLD